MIVYVVAWTAIFNGGAQLVYGFRAHSGGRLVLEILLGLLYIVAGVFILMHPAGGLLALTLIIASSFWFTALLPWCWRSSCDRTRDGDGCFSMRSSPSCWAV